MNLKNTFRKLPIFKIIPIECDFTEIAITDDPAIEEFFLKFSEDIIKLDFAADKQIITGPVMIPDMLIYRNDKLGERFVTYDKEGIQQAAGLFMKNGLKFNLEHTENKLQIEILESYFATEPNKFGVPEGSWIVSAKVLDSELWNTLKENNTGFSFQSLFSNEVVGVQEVNFNKNKDEVMNLKEKLQAAINAVLFAEEKPIVAEEFAVEPEVPVEAPVDEPIVEDEVKPLSEERVQEMINEAVMSATEQIMVAVQELVNQGKQSAEEMSAMKVKLEEFSKQPLSQPITETVNSIPTESGYSYLSGVKF